MHVPSVPFSSNETFSLFVQSLFFLPENSSFMDKTSNLQEAQSLEHLAAINQIFTSRLSEEKTWVKSEVGFVRWLEMWLQWTLMLLDVS